MFFFSAGYKHQGFPFSVVLIGCFRNKVYYLLFFLWKLIFWFTNCTLEQKKMSTWIEYRSILIFESTATKLWWHCKFFFRQLGCLGYFTCTLTNSHPGQKHIIHAKLGNSQENTLCDLNPKNRRSIIWRANPSPNLTNPRAQWHCNYSSRDSRWQFK